MKRLRRASRTFATMDDAASRAQSAIDKIVAFPNLALPIEAYSDYELPSSPRKMLFGVYIDANDIFPRGPCVMALPGRLPRLMDVVVASWVSRYDGFEVGNMPVKMDADTWEEGIVSEPRLYKTIDEIVAERAMCEKLVRMGDLVGLAQSNAYLTFKPNEL